MPINSLNPQLIGMLPRIEKCKDCYSGTEAVKEKGEIYLPPTGAMIEDGYPTANTKGTIVYNSYRTRAEVPGDYSEAVLSAVGVMHREDATIELPEGLEYLREDATGFGESLQMVLRKINSWQLEVGRLAILVDIAGGEPKLILYRANQPINWAINDSQKLYFVVLDQSGDELNENLEWVEKKEYLVLALTSDNKIDPNGNDYRSLIVTDESGSLGGLEFDNDNINLQGKKFEEIPLVFINTEDISPNVSAPPLEPLADLCFTIYRGDADHRQTLFQQSQDTFVTIGERADTVSGDDDDEKEVRVGAGAHVAMQKGGDAKYVGFSSQGLAEQSKSLENDRKRAEEMSAANSAAGAGASASGDSLRERVSARTVNLSSVADTGALGLQTALRFVAKLKGLDENKVVVTANKEFAPIEQNAQSLTSISTAKDKGLPLSNESIHKYLQDRGFTQMSYEDELKAIAKEEPDITPPNSSGLELGDEETPNANE